MSGAAFLRLAVLATAAGVAGCRHAEPLIDVAPGSARGANVVLITLDTVRADYLGCYGRAPSVTPNLDRLCAQGLRFANAVTPAPLTLPAHATLLTGLTPPHHGMRYNAEFPSAPQNRTLAEDLHEAGYFTAAAVSAFVLDRRFGLARGFDVYDDSVAQAPLHPGQVLRNERDAEAVTDAALSVLANRDVTKPVFLWVHYYDAHAPYAPRVPPVQTDDASRYAAEIGQIDTAVGRLLAAPALAPERTVVVVAADHGEGLGDHAERTHGLFLYDTTTHIPLLLRLPPRLAQPRAGHIVTGLVGLVDLRASLLSLLGLTHAPDDGIDWFSRKRGPQEGVYQEASLPYFDYGFAPLYSWRGRSERFVEAATPEYYDLAADPAEKTNRFAELSGKQGNPADRARQRLDALRLGAPSIVQAAARMEQASPDVTARLRSLGYIGAAPAGEEGELPDPKSQIEVVNLHEDAAALIESGNAAGGLVLLERARALSPRNESVLRLTAKAQLALQRIDDAEATLRVQLELRPNADSLLLLAQILVLRGEFELAETLLQQAEALEPRHGGIAVARGDIALREGDPAAARQRYEEALRLDPSRVGPIARQRLRGLGEAGKPSALH